MIPYLLAVVGGYLIGDSMKDSEKFADGGEVNSKYISVRVDGIFGVQKRVNSVPKTFFAVDGKSVKDRFDLANKLATEANANPEKANISFWVKDGINAVDFISKYLVGYEIEEDEDNRVNVFDLEIVFGNHLNKKKEVNDYMIDDEDDDDEDDFADGGYTEKSAQLKGGVSYYSVDIDLEDGSNVRDLEYKNLEKARKVFEKYKKSMVYDGDPIENVQLIRVFKNGDSENV